MPGMVMGAAWGNGTGRAEILHLPAMTEGFHHMSHKHGCFEVVNCCINGVVWWDGDSTRL